MRASWLPVILPPVAAFAVIVAAIELFVRAAAVPAWLFPPPSEVLDAILVHRAELFAALWQTTIGSLLGFALSASGGLLIAIALSSFLWLRRALYPYAIFFQTVPIVAIAPLLVIWFDYGLPTIVASAFIVSIFPMIANALAGLLSTDPALRDLFRLYGAGPIATMWKLRLPSALPSIMTGLRITAGLAVIGAIVGEFIGATGRGGLGSRISASLTQQQTAKVFAAILLSSLLGLGLFALVNFASWVTLRHWRNDG